MRSIAQKCPERRFSFSCKKKIFLLLRSVEIEIIVSGTMKEKKALNQGDRHFFK